MMRRYEDWPERLEGVIEAARDKPFRRGSHDCVTFAGDCVKAITGDDLVARWRRRYRSRKGADRLLEDFGARDLIAAATKVMGPPIDVRRTQRGDVVAIESKEGPALGICLGERCAFAGPAGLSFAALGECLAAWRIG